MSKDKPKTKRVEWTALGEQKRAHSEHGQHKAGEIVETEHAEALVKAGFAKAAGAASKETAE